MNGLSLDIAQDRLGQLRQLFPEVFREDQVDFDALKTMLGEAVTPPAQERYGLTWAGKYDAYREIQKQTTATLTPDRANSINFDTSDNIFIEGENLEVLRVLQKSYYGKVKMIYIDPPYNTGNDSFVYPDDYSERKEEYNKRSGFTNDDGFLNKQDLWKKNSRENGHFHSVWLSMMYPRLYLSRNLLKEDGIIFVSIDDTEQSNLKLLLNEVFGEENFIECFIWKKSYGGGAKEKYAITQHEYIFMYSKNKSIVSPLILPPSDEIEERYYKYKDDKYEQRGNYRLKPLDASESMDIRENLRFPIINPKTGDEVWPKKQWWWSKDRVHQALEKDELVFTAGGSRTTVSYKQYLKDEEGNKRGAKPFSIIDKIYTQQGTNDLREHFNNRVVLQFPKPVNLIQFLIQTAGVGESEIVLDFFSGSGTTAEAVLSLNSTDLVKRFFVCVQLAECLGKDDEGHIAGLKTIADVGKTRIRRVIEKQNLNSSIQPLSKKPHSLGFRAYNLTPTHFKIWRSDISNTDALLKQLDLFQQPLMTGYTSESLLTELLLKAGYALTTPVERQDLADVSVYCINNGTTYMALEAISRPLIEALTAQQPKRVITLDKLFNQDSELLSNTRLQLREASIEFDVI